MANGFLRLVDAGARVDRITLVASKGEAVTIATSPWVNRLSESEIQRRLPGA